MANGTNDDVTWSRLTESPSSDAQWERALIVEFVGLPGSGKSTVSHSVAEILRGAGQPVSERSFEIAHRLSASLRRLAKLRLACRTLRLHPRWALSLAIQIARTGQPSWREAAARIFELLYVCGLVAEQSRQAGIHLLDQGFFVALWSICLSASSSVSLGRLVEIGTKCCGRSPADLVIVLEVEPATAVERLLRRPGTTSRLEKRMATTGFERDLQAAVASLRQVRAALCARERAWSVRIVSGKEARAANTQAQEVAELVLASLPSAPRAPHLE
jgi:thymidylate kinase